MEPNLYHINEIFYSLQGEGVNTGKPAVFIRFSGCNLACPFCDTQHQKGEWMTWRDIVAEASKQCGTIRPAWCIITGGEPSLQLDEELLAHLHDFFRFVAVETNGTRTLPEGLDLITISPKGDFVEKGQALMKQPEGRKELKLVFTGENNPQEWYEKIHADHYYLQPCDTGNEEKNREILDACVEYIKEHPYWSLSLQTQKIINVR